VGYVWFCCRRKYFLLQRGALNNGKIGTAVLALLVTFIMFVGIMIFSYFKADAERFFSG
jgi:hypothetical protein